MADLTALLGHVHAAVLAAAIAVGFFFYEGDHIVLHYVVEDDNPEVST